MGHFSAARVYTGSFAIASQPRALIGRANEAPMPFVTRERLPVRAAVPAKEIGDILGHRSPGSTAAYLKLATEDLRAVALEIPREVNA